MVHTLVVNDLTRLSRNQYLFAEIAHVVSREKVKVCGIMEPLDFMNEKSNNEDTFSDELQGWFLAKMAEMKIRETLLGDLRGLLERLEQGKAIGSVPAWIERIKDERGKDQTRLKSGAKEVIEQVHEIFLKEGLGAHQLAKRLNECKIPTLSQNRQWTQEVAANVISSRALLGYQVQFGREFLVFDPVITDTRWRELHNAWINRPDHRKNLSWTLDFDNYDLKRHKTRHLATSLLRCTCAATSLVSGRGGSMAYRGCKNPQQRCYVCGNVRRKKEQRHIYINDANVDQFINGLMETDPIVFLREHQRETTFQDIQRRLREVEQALPIAQERVATRMEEIERLASEKAIVIGMSPSSQGWGDVVSGLTKDLSSGDVATADLAGLIEKRERLITSLREYVPSEQMTDLQNRITQWSRMENWEKNDLLLRIFDRWEFRKINGSDHELEMVMRLHGGRELPPVPVKTWGTARKIIRRLPTADEWITSVIASRRNKHALQTL